MTAPVQVAGLTVPAVLAAKIIEAIRWEQPDLAELDDNAIVRAWLKWQIGGLMTRHVIAMGMEQTHQAVEVTREFYQAAVEEKHAQIRAAVETIVEQPDLA